MENIELLKDPTLQIPIKRIDIHNLNAKIEAIDDEILDQYPDDISFKKTGYLIAEKMTYEDIKIFVKLIDKTFNSMGMPLKVFYDFENQLFNLDFRHFDLDNNLYGKVVELELNKILCYKTMYEKNIKACIIGELLCTLTSK